MGCLRGSCGVLGELVELAASQNSERADYLETVAIENRYLIVELGGVTVYLLVSGGLLKSDEFTLVRRHQRRGVYKERRAHREFAAREKAHIGARRRSMVQQVSMANFSLISR
ncbi:TPA: hypothetical protein ACVO0U_004435 [Vibrio alginolyticus]|uniref:hypothetical protein n=1 Tax=Vibrio sp. YT-17 TaxID=3074708 RepID=UPI0029642E9B|nr:hypothetical protein [Vibrio sp. YT-17]MDW1539113.1 hypothetical protein [Vibrio sp. YT-17]